MQYPGWDEVELEHPNVGDDGVAGIRASIGSDHKIGVSG